MLALLAALLISQEPPRPVPSDDRLVVELVAQEPDIVTPTGIAVDARGRIWAVENNTHMRPKNYPGHPTDRVRLFEDFGPDGRARKITTVVDGFEHGMNIAIGPGGEAYLVTRNAIEVIGEKRRPIVRLETAGDYNHNGLFGMAFDPKGELYFAIGRNTGKDFPLGAPWTLVGTDGSKISGTEGGRIFRCRADGSALAPVALGFWNTFHMTFDAFGRLFAVDNDPGGGSECRLLHIVPGGDYGFRPRAGYREGHPFLSWNGELPGTLPMVAFTGEAPAGVLAYESDSLPDLRGALLVTSWGDHEVERFRPVAHGASFTSHYDALIRGGENFRPVGIAQAPDGSICLSDWVDRSYPVHGKGRIWRIRSKSPSTPSKSANEGEPRARIRALWARSDPSKALDDPAEEVRGEAVRLLPSDDPRRLSIATTDASKFVRLQALLGMKPPSPLPESLFRLLEDPDPFLVGAAISVLGRPGAAEAIVRRSSDAGPKIRIGVLLSLRRTGDKIAPEVVRSFLKDADPSIRRAAIQWVGEDGLAELAPELAAAASHLPVTLDVFEAYLGALEFLTAPASGRRDSKSGETHLVRILSDDSQPAAFRAYALRMLRPDHPLLSLSKLGAWLEGNDEAIRLEAARTLSTSIQEPSQELLRKLAGDRRASTALRLEAAAGLGHSASTSSATRKILVSLLDDENADLRFEAVRSLGGSAADPEVRRAFRDLLEGIRHRSDLTEKVGQALKIAGVPIDLQQPATNDEWAAVGREPGDAASGERIFFHPRGPQCSLCHRVRGRGGEVGPDLSRVSRGMERGRLLESILEPSKEIAPDFAAWEIITHEGDSTVGRILREDMDAVVLLGPSGRPVSVKRAEIALRRPSRVSMMPEGLQRGLTRKEFRDLVAFLVSLR